MLYVVKKLNLGCGKEYRDGWVNLDISNKDIYDNEIKVDVKHDLNKFPWPFKSNEFDFVLLKHLLEHLNDIPKVMNELIRITRKGGIIKIIVPHFSCYHTYRDPTHKIFPSIQTINYIKKNSDVVSSKLRVSHNRFLNMFSPFINKFPVIYERFFYGFFPVQEIIWILRVNK